MEKWFKRIPVFTLPLWLAASLLLILAAAVPRPALAGGPPPDAACRTCHGDSARQLTLPSGETLPLLVPLAELDASPHHSAAGAPVACFNCHRSQARYRYPHQPNPAQTRAEFVTEVAGNCTRCHTPHNPLHSQTQAAPEQLPTCVDCHGSHAISPAETIATAMPAACLTCHTGQTRQWAANLIPARPGIGQPAPGYVGSDRCGGCHEDKYFSWRETLHAKMIQDPAADPAAIVGDFNRADPALTFSRDDVAYTIGSRWKQRYLTQTEDGGFYILPAQWNVAAAEWVPYNPDTWQQNEWRQSCGSCHVTGLNTQTWGFAEFGIGCESCHGPGAEHAADPKRVKPFAEVDDQVCGACHSRGTSPDGYPFPATYRPGDTLTDHFTFTGDESAVWPDGSAKKHHQQYMDWRLGSPMALNINTNCVTCHAVHDSGAIQSQLVAPLNDLCLRCHNDKKAIIKHVPFHDRAEAKHKFVCSDCHLPKMATSAVPFDIHNHSFTQPNPQASIDYGGLSRMPNACNTCHTDLGEDPAWAAGTIAYVDSLATPAPADILTFGPGPTPTSPPPPTPLPSVGQKADVNHFRVATGVGLRNACLGLLGLLLVGIVVWAYRALKHRRLTNA